MLLRINIFLLFIPIISCISQKNKNNINNIIDGKVEIPTNRNSPIVVNYQKKTPIPVTQFDTFCTIDRAISDLGLMKIWLRKENELVLSEVDLSGVSGKGLKSDFTHSAIINYHYTAKYKNCNLISFGKYKCSGISGSIENTGQEIPICRVGGSYPRGSIENAALAAVAGIKEAYLSIKEADPTTKYDKVEILLIPNLEILIETNRGNLQTFMTDNAFWSPKIRESKAKTIALLPHSKENEVIFLKRYLWEQKGVVAHEYGHHFFNHKTAFLSPKKFSLNQVDENESLETSFPEIHHKIFGQENRSVTKKVVISAFNEGIADLIAHYTHDYGNNSKGILVFGNHVKARDIEACDCDDGEHKTMSAKVLKHFFSPHTSSPHHRLSSNHQDIHTIGAILAYAIDQSLKLKFNSTLASQKINTDLKLQALIEWFQVLEQEYKLHKHDSAYQLLKFFSHSTIALAGSNNHKTLCASTKRIFPVYFEQWSLNKNNFICSDK